MPTIGIGAGPDCDGQVLVWQDMAGLSGFHGRFVKAFADLRGQLEQAAQQYRTEVRERSYPGAEALLRVTARDQRGPFASPDDSP